MASSYELARRRWAVPQALPSCLRAEACLVANQAAQASAAFQVILNRPASTVNEPIGPLAHLGLARAYALGGDANKARAEYREFLALWKDADADVPILKQAKAKYAKLI